MLVIVGGPRTRTPAIALTIFFFKYEFDLFTCIKMQIKPISTSPHILSTRFVKPMSSTLRILSLHSVLLLECVFVSFFCGEVAELFDAGPEPSHPNAEQFQGFRQ